MADFTIAAQVDDLEVISSWAPQAVGLHIAALVGSGGAGSAVFGTIAGVSGYFPFTIGRPFVAMRMLCCNGATVASTFDMGIYDAFGHLLVHTGATTQVNINTVQSATITNTTLLPGQYYMALASGSSTATWLCSPAASNNAILGSTGCLTQTSATLNTTATFAAYSRTVIPLIAVSGRTVV